jgi:hypothetical protein
MVTDAVLMGRRRRLVCLVACLVAVVGCTTLNPTATATTPNTTVTKTAASFDSAPWVVSDDNTASGSAALSADLPPDEAAKGSLALEADFSGKGFEFFRCGPAQALRIPGVTKRVSLWVRSDDARYTWAVEFKDGWGRTEAAGQRLEWTVTQGADRSWKRVTFDVPPGWVQPLSVDGALVQNWDHQTEKASARIRLSRLTVETDIADVDDATGVLRTWAPPPLPAAASGAAAAEGRPGGPQTAPVTPLLQAIVTGAQPHNVFSGDPPRFDLTAQNWHAAPVAGDVRWSVTDAVSGATVDGGSQAFRVDDGISLPLPLRTPKFGVYRLDATVSFAGSGAERKIVSSQSYAMIPVARELTDADKDASPYGLNVISARTPMVATFRKAGIVWFRDYSFNYDWMVRAKGADNRYAGWPDYPKIVKAFDDSGARVLANLRGAIRPPAPGVPQGPDLAWTREISSILLAFPTLHAFELDNEYDLSGANASAEAAIDWKNYGLYHKKFGEIARLLGGGNFTAVENGRAGIWPERVRRQVQSGDFADIDVVNSHHYAGAEPPETNVVNYNMGVYEGETPMTLFDQLRAVKRAGSSDGAVRQHWLTEFGWDTLAGPVVSPVQQAAYLERAYLLLLAAGTSKGFWYWDLDSATAHQFFDGCGLFTYQQTPKLSYAAYAALTHVLPRPQYVGPIRAGDDTWGYLFREDGQLVAALWTVDGKLGPAVDFADAKVYDSFANPLETSRVPLGVAPVYAVGVSETGRWSQQANYDLESPTLVDTTAGDTVTASVRVNNSRATAIAGRIALQVPTGWVDLSGGTPIAVPAGQSATIPVRFRVAGDAADGEKAVGLSIFEAEPQPLIRFALRVRVQRPVVLTVGGLRGEPGDASVEIRLTNRSSRPLDGTLQLTLPLSWSTAASEIPVPSLKPMETRTVHAVVRWTAGMTEGDRAVVAFRTADGGVAAQQPLIPGRLTIHHVSDLPMDGDLARWPAHTRLPDGALGSTLGAPNVAVCLAWSAAGLYVGVDVRDSKATAPDPRSFWVGDVLEIFVDTRDKKTSRAYEPGDHQFWLAPLPDEKRVYVGQWKRGSEIPETRYDLSGIPSIAVRKGNGYVLECRIPADRIQGFSAAVAGRRLGLNVNLTVKGATAGDREVFWPVPKSEGVDQPGAWGTVVLGE